MVLRANNQRTSYRYIYGTALKPVYLLKRNDDQQQGIVVQHRLFDCRRGNISKTGQTIQGDEVSNHRTTWYIPRVILDQNGIRWLNALDRIVEYVDDQLLPLTPPRWWQPESTTRIEVKLWETWVELECLRIDPTPAPEAV